MTQHTPGPWRSSVEREPGIFAQSYRITANDAMGYERMIARQPTGLGADDEANAHLIAAAPDLLAACRAAEAWIVQMERSGAITQTREPIATLRAAIAKTEGGQS